MKCEGRMAQGAIVVSTVLKSAHFTERLQDNKHCSESLL